MHYHMFSDAELIGRFRGGDPRAFDELLSRHKQKVYTTAFLIVKDRYVAEDILQEAFIKAIDKLRRDDYTEEGKFGPWVARIAHNMAIDHFRRQKRYPTVLTEDGSDVFQSMDFVAESFENEKIRKETHTQLRALIQTLPEAQREVLIMRHYGEMSFKDIAEAQGVSINTALGRMRYALINLRKRLKSADAYDPDLYTP